MNPAARRIAFWSLPLALLLLGLGFAFRPQSLLVDTVTVAAAPLQVTLNEDGETRVREAFVVAAPIGGRLMRSTLHAGDAVRAGVTPVLSIEPSDPAFLDPRALAERQAAVHAAEAGLELAAADAERAESERDYAQREVERLRTLFARGTVARQAVDDAERAARSSEAAHDAALAALAVRRFELEQARAALITPADIQSSGATCPCVNVRAPIDGVVLQVLQESETVVQAGTPILTIGDPGDLEIVVDYLSRDAVRIQPGQRALIEDWGGDTALEATVRVVEPYGFTKVSALGIEEQRVNVKLDITSPRDLWRSLGHGYQVTARVVIWEADAVLQVPVTALFRSGGAWGAFVVSEGRARLRTVVPAHRAGLATEVASGLAAGERVVLNPPDDLSDGDRIRRRDG